MANALQLDLEKLTNQARFVQMIVDKTLVVSGRKKVDIVADLRKKNFRPFAKIQKAKEAGENEPTAADEQENVEEDESEDEKDSSAGINDYDYLLNMAISSLTKEKVCLRAS